MCYKSEPATDSLALSEILVLAGAGLGFFIIPATPHTPPDATKRMHQAHLEKTLGNSNNKEES